MLFLLCSWRLTKLLCLLKLLHLHLENSKRLKGKLKKGEEPGWNATKELRSVRYVFCVAWFCFCLLSCPIIRTLKVHALSWIGTIGWEVVHMFVINCSLALVYVLSLHIQAKALAEKNQRDLQVQREQAERHVSGCCNFFFACYYCSFYSSFLIIFIFLPGFYVAVYFSMGSNHKGLLPWPQPPNCTCLHNCNTFYELQVLIGYEVAFACPSSVCHQFG